MSDEYDIDDFSCPHCGHEGTHSRQCSNIFCSDGGIDESDEDYMLEGTNIVTCEDCKGTGIERWCPNCGRDLSGYDFVDSDDFDELY